VFVLMHGVWVYSAGACFELNRRHFGALTDTPLLSDHTIILISDLPPGIRERPISPVFEVLNLGSHQRLSSRTGVWCRVTLRGVPIAFVEDAA
jgi:hypothetical protein